MFSNESDEFYRKLTRIKSAKWNKEFKTVDCDAQYFTEIREAAEYLGFSISESAEMCLGKFEAATNAGEKVSPVVPIEHKPAYKLDDLKAILDSSKDIIDDLKD